jgi:hypothetical protein
VTTNQIRAFIWDGPNACGPDEYVLVDRNQDGSVPERITLRTPIEVLNAGFEEGLDQQKSTGGDDADYVLSGEHKPGMPLYRWERPS